MMPILYAVVKATNGDINQAYDNIVEGRELGQIKNIKNRILKFGQKIVDIFSCSFNEHISGQCKKIMKVKRRKSLDEIENKYEKQNVLYKEDSSSSNSNSLKNSEENEDEKAQDLSKKPPRKISTPPTRSLFSVKTSPNNLSYSSLLSNGISIANPNSEVMPQNFSFQNSLNNFAINQNSLFSSVHATPFLLLPSYLNRNWNENQIHEQNMNSRILEKQYYDSLPRIPRRSIPGSYLMDNILSNKHSNLD